MTSAPHPYPSAFWVRLAKLAWVSAFVFAGLKGALLLEERKSFEALPSQPLFLFFAAILYLTGGTAMLSTGGELCGSAILAVGAAVEAAVAIGSHGAVALGLLSKAGSSINVAALSLTSLKGIILPMLSSAVVESLVQAMSRLGACLFVFALCLALKRQSRRAAVAMKKEA